MESASSASMMRPLRIRSRARPRPISRGSRWVPPSISGTPQRRSGKPSREPSAAMRRSHHSASSRPPARHQPEIAAMAGLERDHPAEAERSARILQARGEALDRLEVGSGGEGDAARAGEDEDPGVFLRLEAVVGRGQELRGRAVDRVAAFLAVDGDDRHGAPALVGHGLHGGELCQFSDCSQTRPGESPPWSVQIPPRAHGPGPPGAMRLSGAARRVTSRRGGAAPPPCAAACACPAWPESPSR